VPRPWFASLAIVAFAVVLLWPTHASADWLITPFLGTTFGGQSPFLDLELSEGSAQTIFGGSVALLSRNILGVEADFGYSPHFFERNNRAGLVTGSNLSTWTGNVIVAMPLSITRESLRPYLVGGAGLIHAGLSDAIGFSDVDRNLAAFDVGGGAIGMVNTRVGFRFEVRHFRSIYSRELALQPRSAHLSFWRASIGVTIRY
jgi:hypothetical protein